MKNTSINEFQRLRKLAGLIKEDETAIAANLKKAFKSGPEATRAYLDSPEGSSEEARALLLKPEAPDDGDTNDDIVKISNASGQAMGFKPTQKEIDLMKSVSYPLGSAKTLTAAIQSGPVAKGIVTSGDLIIDGHHRWSGAIAIGGNNAQISGKDVQWPGQNTSQVLAAAQLAIAAKLGPGKKTPSQPDPFDTNILGADAIKISKMIMDNVNKQTDKGAPGPLLNDAMMKDLTEGDNKDIKIVLNWLGKLADRVKDKIGPGKSSTPEAISQLRLAIATKVGQNLAALPKNPEAPKRADMPQFDTKVGGPELGDIEGDLMSGKFNISPPFKKESVDKSIESILFESVLKRSISEFNKVSKRKK